SWASRRASPCRRKLTSDRSVPPSQAGRGKLPTVVAAMGGRFIGSLLSGPYKNSEDLLHLHMSARENRKVASSIHYSPRLCQVFASWDISPAGRSNLISPHDRAQLPS